MGNISKDVQNRMSTMEKLIGNELKTKLLNNGERKIHSRVYVG